MIPVDSSIGGWQEYIHDWAKRKGWWDEGKEAPLGAQVANFHTEISEAWEEIRNNHEPNEVYFNKGSDKPTKPEGFPIELADCVIRIMDTCGRYGIDLENAIRLKMEYNETRPYRHGGKAT